jgi:mannosyltransferase OCH1-like enzyme
MTIDFLTDPRCREAVTQAEPRLLEYFDKEEKGAFRSDICRVADLYLKGGYYMDNDMGAVEAIVLPDNIFFSTVLESNEQNFFQSFLASTPGNPILRKALDVMLSYYAGTQYRYRRKGFTGMGTATLKDAYNLAIREDPSLGDKTRLLREINLAMRPHLYMEVNRQNGKGTEEKVHFCNWAVHHAETHKVYFFSRGKGTPNCNNFN